MGQTTMPDELALDEKYLSEAILSLQAAANSLEEAECGIKFSFQSVTGISENTRRFFAELDQNLSHLVSQAVHGAHTVTLVSDEATNSDRQLAHVGAVGFVVATERR